jgi:hypothetical protein
MTDGQELARSQLQEIERRTEALEIVSLDRPSEKGKPLVAYVSLRTGGLERAPEGLPLHERERIRIAIPTDFPFSHPRAYSCHTRFAGFPHAQWKQYLTYNGSSTSVSIWLPTLNGTQATAYTDLLIASGSGFAVEHWTSLILRVLLSILQSHIRRQMLLSSSPMQIRRPLAINLGSGLLSCEKRESIALT